MYVPYAFSQAGLDVSYVYSTAKEMQKLVTLKLIENKICFRLSFAVGLKGAWLNGLAAIF